MYSIYNYSRVLLRLCKQDTRLVQLVPVAALVAEMNRE